VHGPAEGRLRQHSDLVGLPHRHTTDRGLVANLDPNVVSEAPGELREVTREHLNTLVVNGTHLAADSAAVSNRQTEQAVHASTQVNPSARAGVRTLEDRVAARVAQGRQPGQTARTSRGRGQLAVAVLG